MHRAALGLAVVVGLAGCATTAPAPDAVRARALAELREGLRSDEFWPSMHAAEGLTRAGFGAEVIAALEPRLAVEHDDQRRCGLARELVRAGAERNAAVLAEILRNPASNGRVHAAESLFKIGRVDGREVLESALADADPRLATMAAAALARQGHSEALARLRRGLVDPLPENRELAAWALGQVGEGQDRRPLLGQIRPEDDALRQSFYWNALARLGSPDALQTVMKNLQSDDPSVRVYAAEALTACGEAAALPRLEKLLRDPVLDVRIRAADAILAILARQQR